MKLASIITTAVAIGTLPFTSAHFLLRTPPTIGYNDATEDVGPCGGFSATDRSGGVTNWPIGGRPIGLLTTHSSQTWEFRFAKLSTPTVWTKTTRLSLSQTGYPYFCEPIIPGVAAWVGLDAILQVIQHTSHGDLYQCSAIKFVSGAAVPPSSSTCSNSTGVAATWSNP